jgi:hypothetical protein
VAWGYPVRRLKVSEIVDLSGKPCPKGIPAKTPLNVLKDIVAQIESGELILEDILVIGIEPDKDKQAYPMWDSNLRLDTTIYMLEVAKYNLMLASLRD